MRTPIFSRGRVVAAIRKGFHIRGMDTGQAMSVSVNGAALELAEGVSVAALLGQLGLDERKVAVERNEEIVVRSTYGKTTLLPGDRIEIVHFIGGG